MTGRDRAHILVVTEICADEGEWEMEVIHLHDCPMVKAYHGLNPFAPEGAPDGPVMEYDCPTGRSVNWSGFEDFPRPDEIGAGEHRFYLWWSGPDYLGEYDGGVEFVEGVDEPAGCE